MTAPWLQETIAKIEALAELEKNWDRYGGLPIDAGCIEHAKALICRLATSSRVGEPAVTPMSSGRVQFEWGTVSWALEVEVEPGGKFEFLLCPDGGATKSKDMVEASTCDANELLRLFPKENDCEKKER